MVRHYKSISKQSKVMEGIIKQIRDEIRGGKSIRQASKDHGLSESTVRRNLKKLEQQEEATRREQEEDQEERQETSQQAPELKKKKIIT